MTWTGHTHASTRAWRRTRAAVLQRDGHRCTKLADTGRCTAEATEVHHKVRPADGGTDDPTNLVSLCTPHHRQETLKQAAAARWATRTTRTPEPHPGLQ